jgi:hypothetical protein
MVIAALITFGALLVAWILAPERRAPEPTAITMGESEPEGLPVAA